MKKMPVDDMSYKIVPRKVSTFGGQGGKKYDLEEKVRTRGGGVGGRKVRLKGKNYDSERKGTAERKKVRLTGKKHD